MTGGIKSAPIAAAHAAKLAKRTLTHLYNERPAWLALAHATLDAAVATACGWPADLTNEEIPARLLERKRAATQARPGLPVLSPDGGGRRPRRGAPLALTSEPA